MISVVIPTMWKSSHLKFMLDKMESVGTVGEVIIINNSTETPNLSSFKKVRMINPGKNIYVNPSWNLGVKESKYDKICLMNDDIIFDEKVFSFIDKKITEKIGIIGPYSIKSFYVRSEHMNLKPSTICSMGFGTLMFFHKSNYLEIPEEFLIYVGDQWIYDYNTLQGRQNYAIHDFCVMTEMGTTTKHFSEITKKDHELVWKLYPNLEKYKTGIKTKSLISFDVEELR